MNNDIDNSNDKTNAQVEEIQSEMDLTEAWAEKVSHSTPTRTHREENGEHQSAMSLLPTVLMSRTVDLIQRKVVLFGKPPGIRRSILN